MSEEIPEVKRERYLPDDMSSLTPSEVSAEDVEVEEVTEEEVIERPKYTDEELDTLVDYVKKMVTVFNLKDDDFSQKVTEQIKLWLMEVTEMMLLVFYDGTVLHASFSFPLSPVSDLSYFIRPINFIFTIDGFHDEVMFGSLTGDVEGAILHLIEGVFAPAFSETKDWAETIKGHAQNEIHLFMSYLTDIYYKMSGLTRLYIPYETGMKTVDECAQDKWLLKRMESIVVFWTQKIRLCLADLDQLIPHEIHVPEEEYNFWLYKYEVLSALALQFESKDFLHIVTVLEKVQSLFIKPLKDLMNEMTERLSDTKDNYLHLQLLLQPCKTMESLTPASPLTEFADCIVELMHLLHIIWSHSQFYHKQENIDKLIKYVSNQVIMCCTKKVDLAKILTSQPRSGIKVCDIFITWCNIYKELVERLFHYYATATEEGWFEMNDQIIFNQIDAFVQRLQDIIEICEAMIAFSRHDEDSILPYRPTFVCNNSIELEQMFAQVEIIFNEGIANIYTSIDMILNLHEKAWHTVKTNFKQLIKNIEEIVENSITSVFVNVENIEEVLQVLTAILKFSANQKINETYTKKVGEMWNMLHDEVMATSRYQAGGKKERYANLGPFSEKVVSQTIRYNRLQRLLDMLLSAKYLPNYALSATTCHIFEANLKASQKNVKQLSEQWISDWQHQGTFTNALIRLSVAYAGLLECNMDEELYHLLGDAKILEHLGHLAGGFTVKYRPMVVSYKNVVKIILDHNQIMASFSVKEMMLFRNLLTAVERKINLGITKFTWVEEVNENYITECVKSLKELQNFTNFYKKACAEIVKLCETICITNILELQSNVPLALEVAKDKLTESVENARIEIFQIYQKIVGYTLILFERFSQKTSKVTKPWMEFVERIDNLLKESIYVCVESSLEKFTELLTGSGSFRSDPIINFVVRYDGGKIYFDPPLTHLEEFLQSLLTELGILFLIEFSIARQYNQSLPPLTQEEIQDHEINKRILASLEKTKAALEKYLLLWKPSKIYADVMQEVGGLPENSDEQVEDTNN